ncbi:MAG: phytoene/squalene synthase family protein [Acidobacteria bacterium]|mgnify:CR=1 FL=1|nr:MAG: phytoene/squalene synthase family protein [Acidobacteriota bacterium]REK01878.1 MAG: phytoene/squalene synthase family protein [Acidobacteriota bacterium]REK14834.1 MAG: phytoene/squalene synthase family protein [Acidobacteriota bacterium]REK45549.1 MAG: phytoene/squalene synthase family protein [Acidobacteriota bacterium]
MTDPRIESAYRYCESVTRKHAKSFYFAARFLPKVKQPPVFAIYAFCRHVDDEIDEAGFKTEDEAVRSVEEWRTRLDSVYESGEVSRADVSNRKEATSQSARDKALEDVFVAWRHMLTEYDVPREIPLDLIRGVLMDTYKKRYATYDEIYDYSYHVASTVGLMTSEILGYSDPKALEYAERMGVGMQLTNILRDVKEDAGMGRIYLPKEDLDEFGVSENQILNGDADRNFKELMEFQVERARSLYEEGEKGIPYLDADSRFTVLLASRIYGRILDEIEGLDYDVFSTRAHTTKAQKLFSMPQIWLESKRMRIEQPYAE